MIKEITKEEFQDKINNNNGNFSNLVFDFEFDFIDLLRIKGGGEWGCLKEVNFEMNFSGSIFKKDISFSRVFFLNNFIFSRVESEGTIDFFNTRFISSFQSRYSVFYQKINFNLSRFHSDADFSKSNFFSSAHFKKARFNKNLFMGKINFYKKVDFSYAHFSNDYYTSFVSINRKIINGEGMSPVYFIFRNIYFPPRTIFNDIDLSRTVFQDSVINGTVFKNCIFPRVEKRNAFYPEIAKRKKIEIDTSLENLINGKINTLILPKTEDLNQLNISDILNIYSKKTKEEEIFFIVTRFDAESPNELKEILKYNNLRRGYSGFNEIVCQDCSKDNTQYKKAIAFRLKRFDEKKHWEVLEDIYRQMKKSLEESRDWQGAGDFYRGEMFAKIKLLDSKKEKFWYKKMLTFYRHISSFGESTKRVLFVMLLTFFISSIIILTFKPSLGIFGVIEKNLWFSLPVFGNKTVGIESLNLSSWQNVFIQVEIIWFYLLWLVMAIAVRRKFRR